MRHLEGSCSQRRETEEEVIRKAKTAAQPVRDCTAKTKEWPLAGLKLWVFFLGLPPPASCSLYMMAEGPPVSQVKILPMDYITILYISAWTQTSLPKTNMFAASPATSCTYFSIQVHQILLWYRGQISVNVDVARPETATYIGRRSFNKSPLSTKARQVVTWRKTNN